MILSGTGVDHLRFFDLVFDAVAHQKIVNSPSRVIDLAGPDPLSPPGIDALHIAVHISESIGETFGEQVCEARSLLIGKTGGHVVVLRVSQVDLCVRHIEVAACDDRLLLIQLRKIIGVKLVPLLPLAQPLEPIARVRLSPSPAFGVYTFTK